MDNTAFLRRAQPVHNTMSSHHTQGLGDADWEASRIIAVDMGKPSMDLAKHLLWPLTNKAHELYAKLTAIDKHLR